MKVAVLGECMIELSQQSDDQFKMGFGGDTLNTAIYLCRCNGEADYFSVLGNDPYSQNMLDAWRSEGVGIDHVRIKNSKLPGLYIINNDENGERYFNYWRQNSPARTMLSDYPVILDEIKSYEMIFLSGITLSLYPQDDLVALFNCLSQYRKEGGIVIFDNNYRINNWMSTHNAIEVFTKMMSLTDIALLSFDDEKALYGTHSIEDCITRWVDSGTSEVVVKNGHRGCHFYKDKACTFYPLETVLTPVDTTAAGDSFNGAYIAAKLQGRNDEACIKAGQQCASTVIMYKGAIINRDICLLGGDL